jgi:L-seryl-tRNA(Ser) seleniumtransferase
LFTGGIGGGDGYDAAVAARPDAASEARKLPKADRLLAAADRAGHVARLGHPPVMDAVRHVLETLREDILAGAACPAPQDIEERLLLRLAGAARGSLRRVVNATGVVIHTNLGRAPLSGAALEAMRAAGEGYGNLELDLERGERGDRYDHAAAPLARITGAGAALVVNNCASAVLLALSALGERLPARALAPPPAGGPGAGPAGEEPPLREGPSPHLPPGVRPEVIVSRGQLVEIGGGFRIPDVLRRSGADLVEVGTTNRTYLRDFETALSARTRMLLSVHRSNFRVSGFVHDVGLAELVELGRRAGVWVVDDLGSGALLPTGPHGLGEEPTVAERVRAGADLVAFSGDKLLGGPQAGLLVGSREAVDLCRRHPLLRALRVDKVTLAGLSATLAHYERGEALEQVPVWRAIALRPEVLEARARAWLEALGPAGAGAEVRASLSAVGGGTLPGVTLPTFVLALPPGDPDRDAAGLRRADPPVVARIEEDRVVLDPRTVLPGEDAWLLQAVRGVLAGVRG